MQKVRGFGTLNFKLYVLIKLSPLCSGICAKIRKQEDFKRVDEVKKTMFQDTSGEMHT